jgi:hypothetical protein
MPWVVQFSASTLDLRQDPEATLSLAQWCANLGTERLASEGPGQFAFDVFAVSDEDAERLSELQRQYFAQLRSIIVDSSPARRILIANLQLFGLGGIGSPSR